MNNVHALLLPMEIDYSKFKDASPAATIILFSVLLLVAGVAIWKSAGSNETVGRNSLRVRIAQVITIIGLVGLVLPIVTSSNLRAVGKSLADAVPAFDLLGIHVSSTNLLLIILGGLLWWWAKDPKTGKMVFVGLLLLAGLVTIPWLNDFASSIMNYIVAPVYNVSVDASNLWLYSKK